MPDPVVYQPTVVLRYVADGSTEGQPYWKYDWYDTTIAFVGGGFPDRARKFSTMSGCLAALLADAARTLTTGTVEEHGAES